MSDLKVTLNDPPSQTSEEAKEAEAIKKFEDNKAASEAAANGGVPVKEPEAAPKAGEEAPKEAETSTVETTADKLKPADFDSNAAFVEAYTKAVEADKAAAEAAEAEANKTETETKDEADDALEAVGLDINEFTSEFSEKGELGDASYEKLEKAGIPREMVDAYIDGQKAVAEKVEAQLFEGIGGREGFQEMSKWAAENYSDGDLAAYNEAVNGAKDFASQRMALKALYADYRAATGNNPKLLDTGSKGSGSTTYASVAEMTKAMHDPRYQTDPAYRQSVIDKIERSPAL